MENIDRVKTGIKGLDEMLNGGFPARSVILLEGAPGTGKTTLGIQFIYNGITLYNEPGIIVTFEQFPHQLYRDAKNFGWDLRKLEEEDKLKVVLMDPKILYNSIQSPEGIIEKWIKDMSAKRIMVDSLTHLQRLSANPEKLRQLEYSLFNAFKREELTAIVVGEQRNLLGALCTDQAGTAFLADGVIILRYVELESTIQKAIVVIKLRGSDHDKDIRKFSITSQGVVVESKFEGCEGIISGSPHRRMEESFMNAFIKKRKE